MRYVYTLQKYKKRMQRQLYQKTALLDRYALKGYISKKIIDDREYKYLQYHNEVGELISVFLNDTNYELFLEASRSREQIERRIKSIAGALAMMKSVPTVDENNNDETDYNLLLFIKFRKNSFRYMRLWVRIKRKNIVFR